MDSAKIPEKKRTPSPFAKRPFFYSFNFGGAVLITVLMLVNACLNGPYPIAVGIALSLGIGCSLMFAIVWAARGFRSFGRRENSSGAYDSRGDSGQEG